MVDFRDQEAMKNADTEQKMQQINNLRAELDQARNDAQHNQTANEIVSNLISAGKGEITQEGEFVLVENQM